MFGITEYIVSNYNKHIVTYAYSLWGEKSEILLRDTIRYIDENNLIQEMPKNTVLDLNDGWVILNMR